MIVWLASYPRSGNTMIRVLVNQALGLRTYSQYNDRNDLGADPDVAATVGHVSYEGSWDDFYEQARTSDELCLIKTHDLPRDGSKAIYVLRDGRSSIVSYRHYIENFGGQQIGLAETIIGAVPYGSWSDHVNAWRPLERPGTLFLRYEDIVADREKAIGEVARFLGVGVSGAARSDFDELHAKQPNFFRSGSNKRNIEEFDASHLALFRMLHGETMARYGYDADGEPVTTGSLLPVIASLRERLALDLDRQRLLSRSQGEAEALSVQLKEKNKALADLEAAHEAKLREKNGALSEAAAVAEYRAKALADLEAAHDAKLKEKNAALAEAAAVAEHRAKALEDLRARHEAKLKEKNGALSEAAAVAEHRAKALADLRARHEAKLKEKNAALSEAAAVAEHRAKALADLEAAHDAKLKEKNAALAEAAAVAEHRAKALADLRAQHEAKLREKNGALAEAAAVAEDRLQRASRAEKQNAELEEVGRQQQAELEYRQQLIARLESRLATLQRQLLGNPITLLRARRRVKRLLAEEAAKPRATATAAAKPAVKGASQAAKWVSLVPDEFRSIPAQTVFDENDRDFGIAVFGFNRPDLMECVLTSLGHQKALGRVHVFIDGDQGRPHARPIINEVADVAARFPVRAIHRRAGNLGFRKMMLQAMTIMSDRYDKMLFLEDDCFPTRDCCRVFRAELSLIDKRDDVFSVYGHPFGLPNEGDYFTRFQGWGWGTTAAKLKPVLSDLIRCYWMDEADFLAFTHEAMTEEVLQRIDVTPGRQPSVTLKRFFAWDETMCLLTALRNMTHKRSASRVVYNCGAGSAGSHFTKVEYYRKPPFSMIAADEVWNHF